ncbi:hypothetical protein KC19_2G173400 [Ceratodon purpureus]|uniref:Uncharacterized protein n=1 Tax=Ceratodon purpureus TaxID=3225 RepID=A0A8T0IWT5_CERPU|nr:hypothetical protein KC19_2G173400 [Ceratodon purpureus]
MICLCLALGTPSCLFQRILGSPWHSTCARESGYQGLQFLRITSLCRKSYRMEIPEYVSRYGEERP